MAKALPSHDHSVEEEYIDMDLSSTTFLCYTVSSPQNSIEFEFQMSANQPEREAIPSPADELFYKGKLLPLQIPPRLQMVQKLLQNTNTTNFGKETDELDEKMMTTTSNTTTTSTSSNTATSTPFESCKISPANSCYVSGELNPGSFLYQCSRNTEKSWSKKLKLIRQSSLGLKLKASRAYLQSLFTKSAFRDEPCEPPRAEQYTNGNMKAEKKNPFGQIQQKKYIVTETNATTTTTLKSSIDREKMMEEDLSHRKSFSGVIKWRLTTKSSSTSSSCSSSSSQSSSSAGSNGFCQQPILKRSSSANSEVESSVQGAIAYCKKSQQLAASRKSVSDVSIYSLCP
ncbi:probable membrane-associated kinase regulator 4 [Typha angustifolia]|uniref:probable membrane-associated kinase regulator 4 n=1 Tax=Typha angustifolia TaxID=59011 RepID=UPI003C2C584F